MTENISCSQNNEAASNIIDLPAESELRIEVENDSVTICLILGLAEMAGMELILGKGYIFPDKTKIGIFSWNGAKLKISGFPAVSYCSKETPMRCYLNAHVALEQMRVKAEKEDSRGPWVLVVGPTDVGKSTFCRILLNYAVRLNRVPLFVDLDVGQNDICVPGTVGAVSVERPVDSLEGMWSLVPLVYHVGHTSPAKCVTLYTALTSKLADDIAVRCEVSRKCNASGVIINTCGWVDGDGYDVIKKIAEIFEVDAIIVLDQEKLHSRLIKDIPKRTKVRLFPKSPGVVTRSRDTRTEIRDLRIHQYFYGSNPKSQLYPRTFDISLEDHPLCKIGGPQLPASCMPLGMAPEDGQKKVVPVKLGPFLLNSVLSLLHCTEVNESVIFSNVAGFLVVLAIDEVQGKMTVLSPSPAPLKPGVLAVGDLQYIDVQ